MVTKQITSDRDVVKMTADTMADLGFYIVLAFVAVRFMALFGWSKPGSLVAVSGTNGLQSIGFTALRSSSPSCWIPPR